NCHSVFAHVHSNAASGGDGNDLVWPLQQQTTRCTACHKDCINSSAAHLNGLHRHLGSLLTHGKKGSERWFECSALANNEVDISRESLFLAFETKQVWRKPEVQTSCGIEQR